MSKDRGQSATGAGWRVRACGRVRVSEDGSLNPARTDPGRAGRDGGSGVQVAGASFTELSPFQARLVGATAPQTKSNSPLTAAH